MKEKLSILLRGFTRTVSGSFVSGLFIMAGAMFRMIPNFKGYEALALGIAGSCMIICGCISFYLLGGGRPAQGKYSR